MVAVEENQMNESSLGFIQATTNRGIISYSIVDQTPFNALEIDSLSGELRVANERLFDFEKQESITATVLLKNQYRELEIAATIDLIDLDEGPDGRLITIWKGEKQFFQKQPNTDPNLEENQDRITDNIWISRGINGGHIYNVRQETQMTRAISPKDTEWAEGQIEEINSLEFKPFRDAVGVPQNVVNNTYVLHLISEDIYMEVTFFSWSQGKIGEFSYERSTP